MRDILHHNNCTLRVQKICAKYVWKDTYVHNMLSKNKKIKDCKKAPCSQSMLPSHFWDAPAFISALSVLLTCAVPAVAEGGASEKLSSSPVCCTHLPFAEVQFLLQPGTSVSDLGVQQHALALLGSMTGTGDDSWFYDRYCESSIILQWVLGVLHGISGVGSSSLSTSWHTWGHQLTSYWAKEFLLILIFDFCSSLSFFSIDHFFLF